MKTTAIVPALNEEKNIARVLEPLLNAPEINEVLVVDGGSTDQTVAISRKMGARVLEVPHCQGKAEAMEAGVKATDAEVVLFFDADLIGLNQEHISALLKPIFNNQAVMCVGIRERWGGLPKLFIKIDPLLAIGGERAMKRFVFEKVPVEFKHGFAIETGLNYYCRANKLPVAYVLLKGLTMVVKEKKWGFWTGLKARLLMNWQIIKVRFLILKTRKKFKNN